MKHSIETECFGKNTSAEPACKIPECKGLHTEDLHDVLAEETSSVNTLEYKEEETMKKDVSIQQQANSTERR
jgi:hypothetical protein